MRANAVLIAAIILSLARPASAQLASVEDHIKRIGSIDPSTLSKSDCAAQLSKANSLNSADLFYASQVCLALHEDAEASFLLAAGQVRGSADMALMSPAAKADLEAAAALYGFIFYYAGGPGDIEVLRAPAARQRLFQLFDGWAPAQDSAYSPGWNVGKRPDEAAYRQALSEIKASRRQQLEELSRLVSDREYYALQRRFDDLQKRTSGRYVEGTPEAKLSSDLQQRMARRAQALGVDHEVPQADAGTERRSPPSGPGKDETVVAASDDPAAKQCSDYAENLARMSLSKIVRVVMTTGSEWGLVWRADIANSDTPPEMSRFICSQYGTMLESGNGLERPPLP
jgi:hypothetical protein